MVLALALRWYLWISRTEIFCILKSARRVVLIQVGTINRVSEAFALDGQGADCDFSTFQLDSAGGFSEKRPVPTGRFYVP